MRLVLGVEGRMLEAGAHCFKSEELLVHDWKEDWRRRSFLQLVLTRVD